MICVRVVRRWSSLPSVNASDVAASAAASVNAISTAVKRFKGYHLFHLGLSFMPITV